MKKFVILFFIIALMVPVSVFSQGASLFSRIEGRKSSEMKVKYKDAVDAQFLGINKAMVKQILDSKSKSIEINIPLEPNANAVLRLSEYNILTDNAVVSAMGIDGIENYSVNEIPFKCYKGFYNNETNSMAVICFGENFVKGILMTDNDSYTLSSFGDTELSDDCILYENSKLAIKSDFHCGSETMELPQSVKDKMSGLETESVSVSNTFLQANIAIEIDKITYAICGSSVPNATAAALSLFSVVSAVYNRDINVKLTVPYVHVWTTTDPYTGADSGELLDQFVDHWNANFSTVNRTLAHFITRRTGGLGGIAYLDVLCDSPTNGIGYGFSNIMGAYSQLPVYSWDVMVVAHELGHNFGSPHTFSCSWPGGPIDTCYRPEGSCYPSGPTKARVGTIMSYCHLNGSIDLRLGFGPLPKALIRENAEIASCMSAAPHQLLLSYPQGGETFNTSTQQYIYWGTSSAANLNIDLTTNNGAVWTSLAAGVSAQQHYYVWTVPYIPTNDNCKIKIYDPGNASFADTVDASFRIKATLNQISLISPANGTSYFTVFGDTSKVVFSWTSSGTLPGISYKWKIRKAGGQYVSFLSDSNGTASRISVRRSKLDSLAVQFGLTGDSVLCGWAATTYINSDSLTSEIRLLTLKTNSVGINNITTYVPTIHKLYSNYPNPFNPATKIRFELPKDEFVRISIYDISGKQISLLVNERMKLGVYETDFDGTNLASGTYFYRIEMGSFVETKRMVLLK